MHGRGEAQRKLDFMLGGMHGPCMDAGLVAKETGWTVRHLAETGSTNDVAAALVVEGAGDRTVVVADRQLAGRGRLGRRFASPAGGLYASLILAVDPASPCAEPFPSGLVALVALAAAEAIEQTSGCQVALKWPNDLWIERRKVGGILLEAGDLRRPVVAGVGINLREVPADLPPDVRRESEALDPAAGRAIPRSELLGALLSRVDRLRERGAHASGAAANEADWRARLALVGEPIRCLCAGRDLEGVLEDVSLARGLLIRDALSGPVWRQAEHVQDLRPAARTIS